MDNDDCIYVTIVDIPMDVVFYGHTIWPSFSYWIVPGTIADEERF